MTTKKKSTKPSPEEGAAGAKPAKKSGGGGATDSGEHASKPVAFIQVTPAEVTMVSGPTFTAPAEDFTGADVVGHAQAAPCPAVRSARRRAQQLGLFVALGFATVCSEY